MKLKKAKKLLRELGIDSYKLRELGEDDPKPGLFLPDDAHEMDEASIAHTYVDNGEFVFTYMKPDSKKVKKQKKKEKRKSAYDEEIARIQRNIRHYDTGEGQYEPSQEEKEKMEDQRQQQNENQRKYPPKGNPVNNQQNANRENHHQNPEYIQRNRRQNNRNNNRNQRNSTPKDSGTTQVMNKPDNQTKDNKEE